MSSEPMRLYNKYIVQKADGSPVDPNAEYFVLRLDTDDAARVAFVKYIDTIRTEYPEFALDLTLWFNDVCRKIKWEGK